MFRPDGSLCGKTGERYRKLFTDDDLAAQVFTHMATFGRVKLMAVAVTRCLTQVKRHAPDDDDALPDELRARYAPSECKLFADAKDAVARARSKPVRPATPRCAARHAC